MGERGGKEWMEKGINGGREGEGKGKEGWWEDGKEGDGRRMGKRNIMGRGERLREGGREGGRVRGR